MRRPPALIPVALALVVLTLILAACGSDDEETTTTRAPSAAPSRSATPPNLGALPEEFVDCMAEEGFEVQSPADIHSAPPQVLQACFGSIH